jgi:putative transposase
MCSEEYTSKTCECCKKINKSLGSKKTFICPNCKFTIDRDINGARNIMLKVLTCQG